MGGLGRFPISEFFPGQHAFADMDAAVVDDLGFIYLFSSGLLNFGHRIAEQHITNMAQMQRLVGVGRRIFYHHRLLSLRNLSERRKMGHRIEKIQIIRI